jgi:putative addiction module component (TIGR02574 family)
MEHISITFRKGDKEITWWSDSSHEKEIEAYFNKPGLFDSLPDFVSHYDDGTVDEHTKSVLNDRIAEYEAGKVKTIPAEEVMKKMRKKYGK